MAVNHYYDYMISLQYIELCNMMEGCIGAVSPLGLFEAVLPSSPITEGIY